MTRVSRGIFLNSKIDAAPDPSHYWCECLPPYFLPSKRSLRSMR